MQNAKLKSKKQTTLRLRSGQATDTKVTRRTQRKINARIQNANSASLFAWEEQPYDCGDDHGQDDQDGAQTNEGHGAMLASFGWRCLRHRQP
jgi:hypothetical protein